MIDIANILLKIHQINVEEIGNIHLPKYDFIDYFFPGVKEHNDLNSALISLVQIIQIKRDHIIHGELRMIDKYYF